MDRFLQTLSITCILMGLTATVVFSQEPDSTDTKKTASVERPIEEITVVGQQSLTRLLLSRPCVDANGLETADQQQ